MTLNIKDYENKAREAVRTFWKSREAARKKQTESGRSDQGERASVTAGKNMDGFLSLISDIVKDNGLPDADIHHKRTMLTLPGYFRPTKIWDLLISCGDELVAAIELKSQVGPSFGNNFNNRAEEAIGTAYDLWTAYREGAFGKQPRPFVGWFMMVEDATGSRNPVTDRSPHFSIFEGFENTSYLKRYDIMCQRMMQEQLYSAAAVIASEREGIRTGDFTELSPMTGLWNFVTAFAGHIAATATRLNPTY